MSCLPVIALLVVGAVVGGVVSNLAADSSAEPPKGVAHGYASSGSGGTDPIDPSTPVLDEEDEMNDFFQDLRTMVDEHKGDPVPELLPEYYDFNVNWFGVDTNAAQLANKLASDGGDNRLYAAEFMKRCDSDDDGDVVTVQVRVPYRPKADSNAHLKYEVDHYQILRVTDDGKPYRIKMVLPGAC